MGTKTMATVVCEPEAGGESLARCVHHWLVTTVPDRFRGFSVDRETCQLCGEVRYIKRDYYSGKSEIINKLPDPAEERSHVHFEPGVQHKGSRYLAVLKHKGTMRTERFETLEEANEWIREARAGAQ